MKVYLIVLCIIGLAVIVSDTYKSSVETKYRYEAYKSSVETKYRYEAKRDSLNRIYHVDTARIDTLHK